jgi:Plasmid stabilization system protein
VLKIRLTQTAEQQLEDIWFYTLSEWGEVQANQYVSMIEQGITQLLNTPILAKPDLKSKGFEIATNTKTLDFFIVSALNTSTSLAFSIAAWILKSG